MNNNLEKLNRERFTWEGNSLLVGEKDTDFKIYPSGPENRFYRIRWPNGDISEDFYNKTRAKENTIKVRRQDMLETAREARGCV